MSVFQYRFGSQLAKIHHLVKSGLLGKAYVSSVETAKTRGADYYKVPWRGKFATELGGVLLTQSIHTHDLFFWLMGSCKTVSAFKTTRVNPIEVEDCAVVGLVMQDGSLASLTATLGSVRQLIRVRLCFEHATLELLAFEEDASQPGNVPWTVLPRTPEIGNAISAKMAEVPPTSSGFVRQYELFHEALLTEGPMPVSLEDARRSLELITAIFQSTETGRAVSLPLLADAPKYDGWGPEKPAASPAKPQLVG
jgi:predicted dehydrogenase